MKIAALSDQHGFLPDIPACDLLLIAGDVCPDRIGYFQARFDPEQQAGWFERKARPWILKSPATRTVLTWGNHDWCGQTCTFRSTPNLRILQDQSTFIAAGIAGLTVWATPWSNQFLQWAFMKWPVELAARYALIPNRIDILVSHQPPYGYGDAYYDVETGKVEHLGSRELLAAIERVRPRVVICGHIHGGHGQYVHKEIPIYNVSVVNEQYQLVHPVTEFELDPLPTSPRIK